MKTTSIAQLEQDAHNERERDHNAALALAERVFTAYRNRDYSLAQHLLRSYPFGDPLRQVIDQRCWELAAEYSQANPR